MLFPTGHKDIIPDKILKLVSKISELDRIIDFSRAHIQLELVLHLMLNKCSSISDIVFNLKVPKKSIIDASRKLEAKGIITRTADKLCLTTQGEKFIADLISLINLSNESERRIPIQYAKRVIGRRIYGGQSTYLPIKLNQGGVLPLIFAIAILTFPATILRFSENEIMRKIAIILSPTSGTGMILYALLTIFFCYFYSAIIFNPQNVAEDLKKYGGFIAGIRPGKSTTLYLERILNRLTFPGSIMLAGIAVFPYILMNITNKKIPYVVASLFGGIGLLIVVSVLIETLRQIEAHLLIRHSQEFIKKAKIK